MFKTLQKNWYVVYTYSKHEKKIDMLLQRAAIESFLPLQTKIRQWSDRKKKVELPLFPNYLFVRITPREFWKVLDLDGVVDFVSNGVRPGTVSGDIIENIRRMVSGEIEVEKLRMPTGQRVRVTRGPFKGAEGQFIRLARKSQLIVNIELLNQSISMEINPYHVEKIES